MEPEPPKPSAGAADRFARRWWYHVFLAVMLAIHLLVPIGLSTGYGLDLLGFSWIAVLVLGVVVARRSRLELGVAVVLLLVAASGALGHPWTGRLHHVSITARLIFMVYIAALILRELGGHPVVTAGTISGAFVVFLLLAEVFVDGYDLVDAVTEQPVLNGIRPAEEVSTRGEFLERRTDLTYFSMVTMTTLGYGDITPRDRVTRSLATLQAFLGQAYLAVLIARLVSLYRSPRATAP